MTKQEYYDLLVKSATDGTFPSINQNGCCVYRLGNKKCAVGLLISDDKYNEVLMEGKDITHQEVQEVVDLPEGLSFLDLKQIQDCHDDQAFNPKWNSGSFIIFLNKLDCFQDVKQYAI